MRKGDILGPLVARQAGIIELCRPDRVESLFKSSLRRAGFAAWILLFYSIWHRQHVEGVKEVGDVFAILGDR